MTKHSDEQRWSRIQDLFHEACAMHPDQRPGFLGRECGDDAELRREVERLLDEDSPDTDWIAGPIGRVSTLGDTLTAVARSRGTEPSRLGTVFRDDLDWIILKSLEKDRARRYETANGLAFDVQRYLNDEPVSASPPSAAYRFKKLVRRNKGAFAAVTAIAALLLAGVAGTSIGLARSLRAEALARLYDAWGRPDEARQWRARATNVNQSRSPSN